MLFIGSDHAGFTQKQKFIKYFTNHNIPFEDMGCFSKDSVNYPTIAKAVCEKIKHNEDSGILICGTGIGMSITANRFKHIRAGLCTNIKMAKLSRQHNNANVLVLSGRFKSFCLNKQIMKAFFNTAFEGGRHEKRINMIND